MSAQLIKAGDEIGRFAILREIGRGGMGLVFSAYDPQLDRRVAIKVLRSDAANSDDARARLLREAKAMAKLRHPNTVTVYEVGTHENQVYLAMEYAEGGTLEQWLEVPRDVSEVVAAFVAAGRGLSAAHDAGLIHRDFKPGNALIGAGGLIQVTDFGLVGMEADALANSDAASLTGLTEVGMVLGTPAFMSPEQHRSETLTPRTDQFSFCVALWHALFGEKPFPGENVREMRETVLGESEPSVPKDARVPMWIENILRRGLSRSVSDRYDSMDALLGELARDESDGEIGRRTRTAVIAFFGSLVSIVPLLFAAFAAPLPGYIGDALITTGFLIPALGVAYYARDSLGASVFNRQLRALLLFLFPTQYLLVIGLYIADQPLAVLYQSSFFGWFMIAALAVLLAERRLWVAALGYYAGFVVVGRDPSALYWATGAANSVMTINCLWIWRPQDGVKGYFKRRNTRHRGIVGTGPRTSQQSLVTSDAVAETLALAVDETELVSPESS